jgi:RHS repeat-associated protein
MTIQRMNRVVALMAALAIAPALSAASLKPSPAATPLTWQIGTYTFDGGGNIVSISGMNDTYLYDAVGRLVQASANAADHTNSQTFSYDAFGNLLEIDASIKIGAANPVYGATILGVDSRTNRLTNTTPCNAPGTPTCVAASARGYDAAGSMRGSLNGDEYDFNTLDQIAERRGAGGLRQRYLYDANGERVAVMYMTATGAVPSSVDFTLRGLTPQILRTVRAAGTGANATWSWREDYVYRDTVLLGSTMADGTSSGKRQHFHLDHLGTPRLATDDRGYKLFVHTYWPFGEEAPGSEADGERMKFTGHERDFGDGPERDVDYMHARHYGPVMARFFSIDRHVGNPLVPQTWNRYAYVVNNPMNLFDPTGLDQRSPGDEMAKGDTCDGTVVDGWCTGYTITVEAKAPEIDWVAVSAGFGDGIIGTLSFGFISGSDMDKARQFLGGEANEVDRCSGEYMGGRVAGTAVTMAAYAYGAVPATLTHMTTEAGAAGMRGLAATLPSTATSMGGVAAEGGGIILPSSGLTMFGDGVYATAGSGTLVPGASSVPMTVSGQGFMRMAGNAAFLHGGSMQTAAIATGVASVANASAVTHTVVDCK